jgi:hypothetical protein
VASALASALLLFETFATHRNPATAFHPPKGRGKTDSSGSLPSRAFPPACSRETRSPARHPPLPPVHPDLPHPVAGRPSFPPGGLPYFIRRHSPDLWPKTMSRLSLISALLSSMLLAGCAARPPLVPPDFDANAVSERILKTGQGARPEEVPEATDEPPTAIHNCIQTGMDVAMLCFAAGFLAGAYCIAVFGHSSGPLPLPLPNQN